MALPVTITGLSTAVATVGPFKATNGNYYFFGRDGTTATTLQAFKALSSGYVVTGTGTAGGATSVGSTSSNYRHAQTWTTDAAAAPISDISFIVGKVGSPTEDVRAEIFATSAGAPTGTALATSNVVAAASIIAGGSLTTFIFSTPFVPSASTQYAAVFTKATTTSNSSNYYQIYAAAASGTSTYAGGNRYTGSSTSWLSQTNDWSVIINALAPGDPDTSWASIATKTGFTTAILKLDAYQVGDVIHLLVQDGTASTALATKYVSFNAANDTFLATTETVSAAVAVTGQVAGVGAGASLVVRSNGNVVAFYNGLQVKISGTFRAHVYYRVRTGVNTWGTETVVNSTVTAVDNVTPIAILGASDRVHFVWSAPSNVANRTLSAANALNTGTTSASLVSPGDGVSYDRSGTTKIVVTSNATGQTVQRFDSSDNPTASYATPTAANATLPHRIGVDISTDEVTIVYRNSADSDLYAIKSTDDGATFGTAVSFFVGTVASADANLSRSSSGSMYQRGSNFVVGYAVNDNGTLKYNEYTVRAVNVNYTDTITPSALPIVGQSIIDTATYADTLTASAVPLDGATLADVFASSDTLAAGALPIGGATLADTFASGDTIAPSSVPIGGATLADVLAYNDAIGAGALPIGGQTIAPVVSYSDALTASALPIIGMDVSPVFSTGSINYPETITPSSVPIGGLSLGPIYTYADTLTASAVPVVGAALADVFARSDALAPSAVPVNGATLGDTFARSDTIAASALPIGGAAVAPIYTANYADTLTASSVPIGGAVIADVLASQDTIAASTVPINGATLADVFGRADAIAASSLPLVGATLALVYTANYADAINASALPIGGQTITPVFSAGGINYSDAITPSSVPIGGATLAPIYTANYADAITPSALPVGGVALADVFARNDTITPSTIPLVGTTLADVYGRADTLTASAVPIGGLALAPVYTANYAETLTASALPLGGQSITPVFSAGGINYTDTITPSALSLVGATLAPVYTANTADAITPSAVPVTGQPLSDIRAFADTLAASSVPVGGLAIAPIFTSGFSDTITPSTLLISGQAITDRTIYHVTITASAVPLVGAAVAEAFGRTDALAAGTLPLVGQVLAPVYTAHTFDAIAASALPIGGAEIADVFRPSGRRYDRSSRVLHLSRSTRNNLATDVRTNVSAGTRSSQTSVRSNIQSSRRR